MGLKQCLSLVNLGSRLDFPSATADQILVEGQADVAGILLRFIENTGDVGDKS